MLQFLSHTPIYAYFALGYLVFVGIKASKKRIVSIYRVILMTVLILYLSLSGLAKFDLGIGYMFVFFLIAVFFGYFSWKNEARKNILVDKKKKRLALPGSWKTLIVVMLIFTYKYYVGYQDYCASGFKQKIQAMFLAMFVSGYSSGLFLGRSANYLYRLKYDRHTETS